MSLLSDWRLFMIAGAVVGGLTASLIIYTMIRFRARAHDAHIEPATFSENAKLEIAWTLLPLAIVMLLFLHTYRVESAVERLDASPVDRVRVEAFRWGWTFIYGNGRRVSGTADHPPELVLEANAPTQIDITSTDVTHSFWIPDFLFKRDAIPGQITSFDLTPERTGEFYGRCAQFCGLQHAQMLFRVRVVDAAEYREWKLGRVSTIGATTQ